MLYDVKYFVDELGKVEGFKDLGAYLVETIKSKEVQEDATPEPIEEAI
jgi:hypothetical protein